MLLDEKAGILHMGFDTEKEKTICRDRNKYDQ